MQHVMRAMSVQIAYMFAAGASFALWPNAFLAALGIAPTTEVWIRVLGLLTVGLAVYYVNLVRERNIGFMRTTVWVRYLFCSGLAVLAFSGLGPWQLYAFAAFEASLAAWAQWGLLNLKRG